MRTFSLEFALQIGHKLSDHILGDLLRFVGAAAAAAPDGLNGLIGHGNFPPVIG